MSFDIAESVDTTPSELELEFKVFLVDKSTSKHKQELRKLSFWFGQKEAEAGATTGTESEGVVNHVKT